MRSPDLGNRLQNVGAYIRYKTSLPLRLNEFAILITAREWTSQYEWYAHYPLALKAGLDAKLADELALGKRPSAMKEDEAAVYDFCTQLHRTRNVDDAAFNRALALFGEQGVVDLIGVSGHYTAVSMTLNVAQVTPPDGVRCRSSRSTARGASELARPARLLLPACGEKVGMRGLSAGLRIAATPPQPDCFAIRPLPARGER